MNGATVSPSSLGRSSTANDLSTSEQAADRNNNHVIDNMDVVDTKLIRYCKLVVARPKLSFGKLGKGQCHFLKLI